MNCSYQLLKNCTSPEPLTGGNEDGLCVVGYLFNLQHIEAQSKETTAHVEMNEAPDSANREERFDRLKAAVVERHEVMRAQFGHVKDCFVCSVAFGLTPAVKTRAERVPFTQLLTRFIRAGRLSKMKTGLQRV